MPPLESERFEALLRGARVEQPGACWFTSHGDYLVNVVSQASTALLQRCRHLVLHSGAIEVDEGAVMFSGAPFAGKSSLALHAWLGGHPLLGDDLLTYEPDSRRVTAFPRTLKPRTAGLDIPEAIHRRAGEHNLAVGNFSEQVVLIVGRGAPGMVDRRRSLPVRSLYFIERADRTAVVALDRMEALERILSQVNPGPSCLRVAGLAQHLSRQGRVFRLGIADHDHAGALHILCGHP